VKTKMFFLISEAHNFAKFIFTSTQEKDFEQSGGL